MTDVNASAASQCKHCGRTTSAPCMNTRDMEDLYESDGLEGCLMALEKAGGGERGIQRVRSLRARRIALDTAQS